MSRDVEEARLASAHTDWLHHELVVSGPAEEVAAFRAAALGASAIPWHLDLDAEEARLLAPMATQGAEARGLARALRQAVGAHHERVLDQVRRARICPLDLHRLVPVPDAILRLGLDDPASDQWLRAHWGTLQALRHVRLLDAGEDRRRTRTARVVLEFHAADWSPWQALLRIRSDWPRLVLDLRPDLRRCLSPHPAVQRPGQGRVVQASLPATRCGTTGTRRCVHLPRRCCTWRATTGRWSCCSTSQGASASIWAGCLSSA